MATDSNTRTPRPEVPVVAGILWRDGRFLAVKRPEGKPMAGYWEFPGGKVEPGETGEQALSRELREELALEPLQIRLWQEKRHEYDHISVKLLFYHVEKFNGVPTALEGHEIAWLTPGEAQQKRFLDADTDIVRELILEQQERQCASST